MIGGRDPTPVDSGSAGDGGAVGIGLILAHDLSCSCVAESMPQSMFFNYHTLSPTFGGDRIHGHRLFILFYRQN